MKESQFPRALPQLPNTRSRVSRRGFIRTGVGTLAAGAVVGSRLLRPASLYAAGTDPVPVPGSPNLAPFHVWAPVFLDAIDAEPATITNFNGVVGIAYVSGQVTRTHLKTGAVDVLPFLDADMRFMQGVYRGADGKPRQGTFGFVWIDVYDPGQGLAQIVDLNPGINPYPNGLFWTMQFPDSSVKVNPGAGSAVYQVTNAPVQDFGSIPQSLGGAPGTPATVSFDVRWSGVDQRLNIKDAAAGFGGEFVRGRAQMSWSALIGDYAYQSDPLESSSSDFASLGTERNGVFFPRP